MRSFLLPGLLLTVMCSFMPRATDPVPATDPKNLANKAKILELVNAARKKGCKCGDTYYPPAPAVTWNDRLEAAALVHAADMSSKKFFSHTASDGSRAGERISRAGYRWMTYGENIGMGFLTETEMVSGWLKSPSHCRNIMNRQYREMGVARVGKYWTQDFGSR